MNRRDFLLKLGRSVLVIAGVTATGYALSKSRAGEAYGEGAGEACIDTACGRCADLQRCGLPQRNEFLARNAATASSTDTPSSINR